MVVLVLSVYSYPALRTTIATRSFRLPPVTAPDEGLYLSISHLRQTSDKAIVNPYYHVPVPSPVSYLKFRLGPSLFGLLNDVLGHRIWLALLLWNLSCWLALCLAAMWLFDRFLPYRSIALVSVGIVLMTVFSFDGAWRQITAFFHGSQFWLSGDLPYIRPFSPQFAIPLLVCYVGLQIRALGGKHLATWGLMAVLQFAAFAALPYTTLIMAGTTAIAVIYFAFSRDRALSWSVLLGYLFVCGFSDLAFAMRGAGGLGLSFPDKGSLVRFQPALILPIIGKTWILIVSMVIAVIITKRLRPEIKWTIVGLGVTNAALAFGDAFLSERAFLMGNHIPYFYNATLVILVTFVVSAWIPNTERAIQSVRIVSIVITVACFGSGAMMAEGNRLSTLAYNREESDLAQWFARGQVSSNDLVITRFANAFYDNCEWIPLLSDAEVLYCRNAQLTLTPRQNEEIQRFREVLYLYLDGKDQDWVKTTTQFERYGLYGEVSSFHTPVERSERIAALRNRMLPLFESIEHRDPFVTGYFRRFRRVWILQNREEQHFSTSRLSSFLDITAEENTGTLLVTVATPK